MKEVISEKNDASYKETKNIDLEPVNSPSSKSTDSPHVAPEKGDETEVNSLIYSKNQ